MRGRRDRKEQKRDQNKHYDGLEVMVDQKALAEFRKPAYQIRPTQPAMERHDVLEYMNKRGQDIKGEIRGE